MAPGSSNNQNNNRQTGTKPKSKSSKKNSVPQEIVAPTRRDQLQQQLNVLVDWANVSGASSVVPTNNSQQQQQHFSGAQQPSTSGQQQGQNILLKPRNNRTPGEGTCYEIDNLSLQDNSRYIPVRPIVRRNLLNEGSGGEQSEPHNTAVGVVIPTTPNSALQQTFRLNEGASASGSGVAVGSTHSINNLLQSGASTVTGVVPKQQHILNPFLLLQQQQQNQAGQTRSTSSPLSYRVPDGASQNQLNLNKNSNHHQQQQQQQQQQQNHHLLTSAAVPSTSSGSRYGSATLPFSSTSGAVEDTLNQIQEYIKLTTNLISSVQIDNLNGGPRPQSVQSISTNQSTTPVPPSASCDELRYRMESQSKNMQALKEQQAHLLRLQQAARQQLQEMESIRQMHTASVAPPIESFQTVEQVQDGIGSIMERMRVLSTFIQNQQELSNMLGPDNDTDVLADQAMLQQKFQELRDKKSQMHNLVSELQNLNLDANRQFDGEPGLEPRNVPIELTHVPATASDARNATKIFLNGGGSTMEGTSSGVVNPVATVEGMSVPSHRPVGDEQRNNGGQSDDDEGPLNEEEASVLTGTADMLSEKINEINAMKSQLRRLKEMMDTVKLIEMKTGQESIDEEDEYEEEDAPEDEEEGDDEDEEGAAAIAMEQQQQQRSSRSRSRSMSSAPITLLPNGTTIPNDADGSEMSHQEREHLNKRVEALQAMTQDLREQAKSIAAERDRLKHARNDLHKRRNNVMELQQQAQGQASEKLTNHVASFVSMAGPSGGRVPAGPKERQQMELKAELEQKKRELERIEKMTQNIKKNTELARSSVVEGVGSHEPQVTPLPKATGPSSVVSSSVESCSGGAGSHHRGTPSTHVTIPPAPAPSAISGSLQNNTAGSNATNDSKTNSADSGVTSDIFAHAQLESASYQSSSTRSFPPPMPDICNRNAATDRYRLKRSDLDADGAPAGGGSGAGGGAGPIGRDHRGSSPWPVFGTSAGAGGLSSSNTGPHSPHYGLPYGPGIHDLSHHATAAGYVGGGGVGAYGSSWSTGGGPYGVAANLLPPHAATPNTPPDPIVFQHIMQTQQMLMNSITQCNQLLWIQQREINNLNNAVLLAGLPPSGAHAGRLRTSVRPLNINTLNNALYDDQSGNGGGGTAGGILNGAEPNNGLANEYGTGSIAPNMINNLCSSGSQPATPTPAGSTLLGQQHHHQHQPQQPHTSSARFGQNYNNLNNAVNNNLANANMQNNHNLYNQQQDSSTQQQQQQTQALNNQVLPGVRANNYWDNFRSYSRQNLLSSNSCKSNEESCSQSGSAGGGSGSGGGGAGGGTGGCGGTGGVGVGGSGSSAGNATGNGSGSGCNTINNQLQRNNSNASNQYMNNQSNKYQQSINITRNNSLSNSNQANSSGLCQDLESSGGQPLPGYHPNQEQPIDDCSSGQIVDHHRQQHQGQVQQTQSSNLAGHSVHGARHSQQPYQPQPPIATARQPHHSQTQLVGTGSVQTQTATQAYSIPHQPLQQSTPHQQQQYPVSSMIGTLQTPSGQHQQQQQQIPPQQQQQQQHSHHAPLNQSNSLDLGELQFHTNPINLGLANKTHPKASGHKKYPLSLRSCRDAGAGGEGSSGCYVSGGGDMNLASTCTYQHDSKSTSKLFEALKENVYQEVKNLITANESRPHFLIQLFRELQLISSDPLRQRTLQSIQELYNRYIESTLQEENHVNNVGSNNLLASTGLSNMSEGPNNGGDGIQNSEPRSTPPRDTRNEEPAVEFEVIQNYTNLRQQQQQQQQQQQYHYIPASGSDQPGGNLQSSAAGGEGLSSTIQNPSTATSTPPGAGRRLSSSRTLNQEQLVPIAVANSEIINIIMGDIVSVINSVDYINDSVLFKIAGVICNHAAGGGAPVDYGQPVGGDAGQQQQHHHHHHHQHHYHHHHARTGQSPAASLLAAASFLSAQGDEQQGELSSGPRTEGVGGGDVFSREDFLRHLESWNRTDKDEFISNLENFLNNILLRSSAVEGEEGDEEEDAITGGPIGSQQNPAYGDEVQPTANSCPAPIGYEGNAANQATDGVPSFAVGEQRPSESAVIVSSSSSNVVYSSTTYDLAEADQVCDMETSTGNIAPGGSGGGNSTMEHPTAGTNFDDRWTVVVQKKPATVGDEQGGTNGGTSDGRSQPRLGGMQQPQLHSGNNGMNGGPSSTNGTLPPGAPGGGNNGNNINNNWQSEEVADEHLEQTEEHRSSYY
uniref:Pericentriolar material 1 protein C-terminal domain-containing protein n=1 Tax=Anopheles minimus TaxID=112268 RepID=A0A182W940_9DIPT